MRKRVYRYRPGNEESDRSEGDGQDEGEGSEMQSWIWIDGLSDEPHSGRKKERGRGREDEEEEDDLFIRGGDLRVGRRAVSVWSRR
jgi:hypothetical protein